MYYIHIFGDVCVLDQEGLCTAGLYPAQLCVKSCDVPSDPVPKPLQTQLTRSLSRGWTWLYVAQQEYSTAATFGDRCWTIVYPSYFYSV
jgi:hypothetical protein